MDNESKQGLQRRLSDYTRRRDKLQAELNEKFSQAKHREINIIEHHIEVCEQRIAGVWDRDTNAADIQITSNSKPVNVC